LNISHKSIYPLRNQGNNAAITGKKTHEGNDEFFLLAECGETIILMPQGYDKKHRGHGNGNTQHKDNNYE